MCNWGMTEVGPCAINRVFRPNTDIALLDYPYLGNRYYCDYRIVNNVLQVKGDIVYVDDWFITGDLVTQDNDGLWYHGRKT